MTRLARESFLNEDHYRLYTTVMDTIDAELARQLGKLNEQRHRMTARECYLAECELRECLAPYCKVAASLIALCPCVITVEADRVVGKHPALGLGYETKGEQWPIIALEK